MATNKKNQILAEFLEVLQPTILGDKDIQKFIVESNLTKEQAQYVVLWFVCACLISFIDQDKNEDARHIVASAMNNIKEAEEFLEKEGYEKVHDLLVEEFNENAKEWYEIISKSDCFKPFLKGAKSEEAPKRKLRKGEEENQGVEMPEWIKNGIKVCLTALSFVFNREDDVDEFLAHMKDDEVKGWALLLLASGLLAFHLDNCVKGREQLPEELSPFAKDVEEAAAACQYMFKQNVESLSKQISNFDKFMGKIMEIIDDHYKEFIKKMYKQLYKMIQEAK